MVERRRMATLQQERSPHSDRGNIDAAGTARSARCRDRAAERRNHSSEIAPHARALPGQADRAARALGDNCAKSHIPGAAPNRWRLAADQLRRNSCSGPPHREALLARDLSPGRPIVILSGNDVEHALLGLAAIHVGIPYAPVSPAYALHFGRLQEAQIHRRPAHARAWFLSPTATPSAVRSKPRCRSGVEIVVGRNPVLHRPATLFEQLLSTTPTQRLDAAHGKVGPDTIAKFLFTSGSTGTPKAVINTQRMWCSNQAMILSQLAFFADEPPVIVDWAPWHHTAGGNHDFGFVLYNGGTSISTRASRCRASIETTVRNLREVATNWYFTVPKGYEALLPHLRADAQLRADLLPRAQGALVRRRRPRPIGVRRDGRACASRPAASASCF